MFKNWKLLFKLWYQTPSKTFYPTLWQTHVRPLRFKQIKPPQPQKKSLPKFNECGKLLFCLLHCIELENFLKTIIIIMMVMLCHLSWYGRHVSLQNWCEVISMSHVMNMVDLNGLLLGFSRKRDEKHWYFVYGLLNFVNETFFKTNIYYRSVTITSKRQLKG